ncbi:hypothetical protein BP00DRAFT_467166 [Aspergillus indologenus CBS 114.80]|uniref:Uncharacterized protein n=1 Tax=Aspergillus indologenus CBS 114.80 TaxID=1450541 RepID=A0A2V5IC32_9EURO|nr:hypothetical protein BP00DRAFT_467166 [Aspergillus indologenus CBS 114.80]
MLLKPLIATSLLAATSAQAASHYVTVQMWSHSNCTGTPHEETLVFNTGAGPQVFQQSYAWQSGTVTSGVSVCGVSFCQYGANCFGHPIVYVGWSPNCFTGGDSVNLDKIMVDTC